jgi:hypothetical protein
MQWFTVTWRFEQGASRGRRNGMVVGREGMIERNGFPNRSCSNKKGEVAIRFKPDRIATQERLV